LDVKDFAESALFAGTFFAPSERRARAAFLPEAAFFVAGLFPPGTPAALLALAGRRAGTVLFATAGLLESGFLADADLEAFLGLTGKARPVASACF
jgi:hypothetical protein